MCALVLLAQAEDGQDTIEGSFGTAVEADEQQEDDTGDDTDDDTGNGSTTKTTASLVLLHEGAINTSRDWGAKRDGRGRGSRGCNNDYS